MLARLWDLARPTVTFLLVLLLATMLPVSGGQGAHANQIVDPIFPHTHNLQGQQQGSVGAAIAGAGSSLTNGPAVASDEASLGSVQVPTSLLLAASSGSRRVLPTDFSFPPQTTPLPPDPPPRLVS